MVVEMYLCPNARSGWASLAISALLVMTPILAVSATFAMVVVGSVVIRPASASQPASVNITVYVTASGFNDGELDLTVTQGQNVTIVFLMDASQIADADPGNYHVIFVQGYNVQTPRLDPSHPRGSVSFIADKTGRFSIYCQTPPCPIHYLMLSGVLNVVSPSTTVSTSTTSVGTLGSQTSSTSGSRATTLETSSNSQSASVSVTTSGSATSGPTGQGSNVLGKTYIANLLGWASLVAAIALTATVLVAERTPAKSHA